jgi:hypothetical protein
MSLAAICSNICHATGFRHARYTGRRMQDRVDVHDASSSLPLLADAGSLTARPKGVRAEFRRWQVPHHLPGRADNSVKWGEAHETRVNG